MKRAGAVLSVVTAIAVVYWRALGAYFFEDDFAWLMSTFAFRPGHIFNLGSYNHFYRPVIELYFWAAAPLFKGSPALFHAANVALHAINALLLFLFVREATGNERYSFLTVLFFAGLLANQVLNLSNLFLNRGGNCHSAHERVSHPKSRAALFDVIEAIC